ncbi:MAG: S-adenosylmethionine decarboxylase [Gemmatimonadota bacterium]|nr:S-adenosylmethionine decarboxylase [Gemmatimonadota bacterium]
MSGLEWIVDAHGCNAAALADLPTMRALFARIVGDLRLRPVAEAVWHQFPHPGGITGVCLLAESHLACHTFPEHGSISVNLFCCKPRPEWDWTTRLAEIVGATDVFVRRVERSFVAPVSATSQSVARG